jgi:hypothetical protein
MYSYKKNKEIRFKKNVKLTLQHAMKAHRGQRYRSTLYLTSALDGGG